MNEKIYNTIRGRILSLYYEPGQRLSQKDIAAELGVSQTPVREVFLRLEWEKLVEIFPRLGIQVTKIDFREVKEIYMSRMLIEGELGRLAAQNITDAHLVELKEILASCRKIEGVRTRENLVRVDKEFRDVLFRAANCLTFQEISERLYNQTLRVWHLTFDNSDVLSEVDMECKEIEATIAAFLNKEPKAAKKLRSGIILAWVDRLHKYFTRI